MKLLIVRHAKAEDKRQFAESGLPDSLRPLTSEGKREFIQAAMGIARIVPKLQLIAASPWVRAKQTAEILFHHYPRAQLQESDKLIPGTSNSEFLTWLKNHLDLKRVCICGHEPHLSQLIGWLTTGETYAFIELKKGSAALLELKHLKPGNAKLLWSVRPSQLKALYNADFSL